jgi:hypothetical protein
MEKLSRLSWSIKAGSKDFLARSKEAISSFTLFCKDFLYKYAPPNNPQDTKRRRKEIKNPMPRLLRR